MPQLEKSEVSTFWKDSSRDVEPESSGFVALQLLIAEERNNAPLLQAEPLASFTDCETESSNGEGGENGNAENEAESKIEL